MHDRKIVPRAAARARATARRLHASVLVALLLAACASAPQEDAGAPVLLIVGATGGTGQEAVRYALARGYQVRALVRDEAKARTLFGDRVSYAVGDVREPRTLPRAMRGVDYVVSALGSSSQRDPENRPELVDYGGVRSLAQAARRAGVEHFVLTSAMGVTNPDHQLNSIFDGLLEWKHKGEQALRESGVPYTIVRPGSLNNDPGGEKGVKVMQGDPEGVVGQIPRADVAAVLIESIGREAAVGRTFEIVSDPDAPPPEWPRFFSGLEADAG